MIVLRASCPGGATRGHRHHSLTHSPSSRSIVIGLSQHPVRGGRRAGAGRAQGGSARITISCDASFAPARLFLSSLGSFCTLRGFRRPAVSPKVATVSAAFANLMRPEMGLCVPWKQWPGNGAEDSRFHPRPQRLMTLRENLVCGTGLHVHALDSRFKVWVVTQACEAPQSSSARKKMVPTKRGLSENRSSVRQRWAPGVTVASYSSTSS